MMTTFRDFVAFLRTREKEMFEQIPETEEFLALRIQSLTLVADFQRAVRDYEKNRNISAYYYITGVLVGMYYANAISFRDFLWFLDILFAWEDESVDNPKLSLMDYKIKSVLGSELQRLAEDEY